MYAVEDAESRIVGFEEVEVLEGRSPRTMIREGIGDWLYAHDDDARRVSISKKDRAAIPMGGLHTEHVYWMVPEVGQFVSAQYYMDRYPRWVQRFNQEVMPGITQDSAWTSLVPESLSHLARPDSAVYEGYQGISTFPHLSELENPPEDPQAHSAWVYDQPRADLAVIEMAKAAIEELDLGQGDRQDFLGGLVIGHRSDRPPLRSVQSGAVLEPDPPGPSSGRLLHLPRRGDWRGTLGVGAGRGPRRRYPA